MTNLSFLNLSNNKFHSSLPHQFQNLSRLSDLDLHSNMLSGRLTRVLSKAAGFALGHLNSIDLSHNNFSGPIDAGIGDLGVMGSLGSLILSHNPLGGKIPESLGKLGYLQVLKLEGNALSGKIPEELAEAKLLETVLLSENGLSGKIPEGILNLENLSELNVSRNRLSGEIPLHKSKIPASCFAGNHGLCGAPLAPCKD
ncbi:hypothetical protein SASPL_143580 [Salvia splendens]|uniref:Uncharacterized protein n=2 Tax=Salvia splendens TaxID=180675 RepID=A0A8X8WNM5_SALSN|nr:hypothetical protein SASPL_143580 [Salvia splendens]